MPENTNLGHVDRQLAQTAREKIRNRIKPTARESAALRRIEKKLEHDLRWKYYLSIPKKDYLELAGSKAKIVNEQSLTYGMPAGGAIVNLQLLLTWLSRFLAENKYNLAKIDGDQLPEGTPQELKNEYARWQIYEKREKAKLAELERQERDKTVIAREEASRIFTEWIKRSKKLGEDLFKFFGPEAQDLLNEALDDYLRQVGHLIGGDYGDSSNDDGKSAV
jgi:hypothetical protein